MVARWEFEPDEFDSDDDFDELQFKIPGQPTNRMFQAVRRVVQSIRLRPEVDGIGYKDVAYRSRQRYELLYNPADEAEQTFIDETLNAFELMFKFTTLVQGVGYALPLSGNADNFSHVFSKSAKAIHKAKFYTARYCWEKKIQPLRQALDNLTRIHEGLKSQFSQVRTGYLQEVAVLRDMARSREDPEKVLPKEEQADIRYFYDPVSSLSEEELAFVTTVVSEKLKMIFEVDSDAKNRANTSQLDAMIRTNQENQDRKLEEEICRLKEEVKDLKAKNKLLAQSGGRDVAQSKDPMNSMLEAQESHIAELKETIAELRPATISLQEVTLERDDLRAAFERMQENFDAMSSEVESIQDKCEVAKLERDQERSMKKELEEQVSRQQQLLAQYGQKANVQPRYLGVAGDSSRRPSQVNGVSNKQQLELLNANEVLRSESFRLKQQVAKICSFRQNHAESIAKSAVDDALHLKKLYDAMNDDDSSSSDESDSDDAGFSKADIYSQKLETLQEEANEVADQLQTTLRMYNQSKSNLSEERAAALLSQEVDEINRLRRRGQELEYNIFNTSILLEAARFGVKEGSKLSKQIQLHCKHLGRKLLDSAEANSRLVGQLNIMQQRAALTIQQLRGKESSAQVQQGLSELEQMTAHDVVSSLNKKRATVLPTKEEEAVGRLTRKSTISEAAKQKRMSRLEDAKMKQQAGFQLHMCHNISEGDEKGLDSKESESEGAPGRWAAVSLSEVSKLAHQEGGQFGRQISLSDVANFGQQGGGPSVPQMQSGQNAFRRQVSGARGPTSRGLTPVPGRTAAPQADLGGNISARGPGRSITPMGSLGISAADSKPTQQAVQGVTPAPVQARSLASMGTSGISSADPKPMQQPGRSLAPLAGPEESTTVSKPTPPMQRGPMVGPRPKAALPPATPTPSITAHEVPPLLSSTNSSALPADTLGMQRPPMAGSRPKPAMLQAFAPNPDVIMYEATSLPSASNSSTSAVDPADRLPTMEPVTSAVSPGSRSRKPGGYVRQGKSSMPGVAGIEGLDAPKPRAGPPRQLPVSRPGTSFEKQRAITVDLSTFASGA